MSDDNDDDNNDAAAVQGDLRRRLPRPGPAGRRGQADHLCPVGQGNDNHDDNDNDE